MNTTEVRERLIAPASLRSAWLIRRACRPGSEPPMPPSISALGTRAATESITRTSTAPDRTRISVISSPCSPVSGWETSRLSMSTPSFLAYSTSSACSASMYAAAPPWRWAFATTCNASVVLPLDSERSRRWLQFAVHDRDPVDRVDVGRLPEAVHPAPRRLHELTPLRPRHRLERAPERLPPAGLHFDEGHQVALARDQVDFRVPHPKPMRHDTATAGQEVLDGLLLPGHAPPVAFVGPI